MNKTRLSIFVLFLAIFAQAGHSSVTLTIGTRNWGNFTTSGVNGMIWGVVVSSTGAAFGGGAAATLSAALEGFSIPAIASPSAPVQIGSSGFYFARSQSNTDNGGPPFTPGGFMNTVQFNLSAPVSTNDPLGLLWFAEGTTTAGSHFGFQDLSFLVPADGQSITSGITSTPGLATNVIGVPEPTRSALFALGFLGLILRRRR